MIVFFSSIIWNRTGERERERAFPSFSFVAPNPIRSVQLKSGLSGQTKTKHQINRAPQQPNRRQFEQPAKVVGFIDQISADDERAGARQRRSAVHLRFLSSKMANGLPSKHCLCDKGGSECVSPLRGCVCSACTELLVCFDALVARRSNQVTNPFRSDTEALCVIGLLFASLQRKAEFISDE